MGDSKLVRGGSAGALAVAVLLLLGALFCIVASRNGMISYIQAFTWLRYIGQAGAVLFVAAAILFLVSLRAGGRSPWYAGAGAVLLAAMVGTLYFNQMAPPPGPFINDVATDLEDPPAFDAVVPLRPQGSNPIEYGGPEVAANQRQVHPEVAPIETALAPDAAFERALDVAETMGWEVVAQSSATGIIEAVATTPFFRFKDDVVVRIRATAEGSRVDLRSRSREGLSDLGKNAQRIMEFRERFMAGS